jgi:hypothetical protein
MRALLLKANAISIATGIAAAMDVLAFAPGIARVMIRLARETLKIESEVFT